jgi:RimJ/RimL family protein N-acetyltransferase
VASPPELAFSLAAHATLLQVSELRGRRVTLVPVMAEHTAELIRIRMTPEVFARWGEIDEGFPFDDPDAVVFTVIIEEAVRGLVQFSEEPTSMYRHAGIDLFLDPTVHGRGIGREVVWLVVDHLVRDRGHHRVVIDPAADNEAAIRCYASVGFRPVGVMRSYERGPDGTWHDGLLMDLLADELLRP